MGAAKTRPLTGEFDAIYRIVRPDGEVFLDHTAAVSLVGPDGHLRARYGYAQLTDPGLLAADLRALLSRQ